MSARTGVEWCDSTANYWEGCSKVSTEESGGGGCDNCYAEAMNHWLRRGENWGPGAPRRKIETTSRIVRSWQRNAAKFNAEHCRRRRVFVESIGDIFDKEVSDAWRAEAFADARDCPDLLFCWLTKRIGNAARMLPADWGTGYRNVMVMATVVNQHEADRDVPKLLALPARWRGLSVEPMLGPVDLTAIKHTASPGYFGDCLQWFHRPHINLHTKWPGIDWVIAGGESGRRARPSHPDWFRSLRDQCAEAGVAFLLKQWGEWIPYEESAQPPFFHSQHGHEIDAHALPDFESEDGWKQREWHCDFADQILARRVGKAAAGRLLDGVEHLNFPGDFR